MPVAATRKLRRFMARIVSTVSAPRNLSCATSDSVIDGSLPYVQHLRRRADAIATACVHAGEPPDASGALDVPIVMSSAFAFESAEHAAGAFAGENDAWIYGRWGNPTVRALEA